MMSDEFATNWQTSHILARKGKSSANSYYEIKGCFQKKKKIMLDKFIWEENWNVGKIVEEKIVPLSFKLFECQKYHTKIVRFCYYVNITMGWFNF